MRGNGVVEQESECTRDYEIQCDSEVVVIWMEKRRDTNFETMGRKKLILPLKQCILGK